MSVASTYIEAYVRWSISRAERALEAYLTSWAHGKNEFSNHNHLMNALAYAAARLPNQAASGAYLRFERLVETVHPASLDAAEVLAISLCAEFSGGRCGVVLQFSQALAAVTMLERESWLVLNSLEVRTPNVKGKG